MKLTNMRITLEYSVKLNPRLNPDLFLPDPKQVLEKLNQTPIKNWLNFIAEEYNLKKKTNLILIPCSFYKPYDPPHDEFYRKIISLKKKLINSKFITVSVPLALEPEEFWNFQWRGFNLIYDCPFFPWIEKFGYKWDKGIAVKVFTKLQEVINRFFERNEHLCKKIIAFFVPDSNELNLVEKYANIVVPDFCIDQQVSYDNNTSEVYCNPIVWHSFEKALNELKLLKEK